MIPCYIAGCDGFLFAHSETPGGPPYLACTQTDHSELRFGKVFQNMIENNPDAEELIRDVIEDFRAKMSPKEFEKAWERGLKIRRELLGEEVEDVES